MAICPILDPSGTADPTGLKAIDALGQMRPAIVIPTDSSVTTARSAAARWKAWFTAKPLTVLAGHLPDSTTLVFAGTQAQNYAAILSLAEAPGS